MAAPSTSSTQAGASSSWLPDIPRWAEIVAAHLKPGGFLYLREGHPFAHVFDDEAESGLSLRYPYFRGPEPDRWDDPGTYADPTAVTNRERDLRVVPHHGLDRHGHRPRRASQSSSCTNSTTLCWEAFRWMEPGQEPGTWILPGHRESIPLAYSIRARKPS